MKRCYIHLIDSDVLALMKYYILYISGLKGNIYLESFGGALFLLHWQRSTWANFLLPQADIEVSDVLRAALASTGLFFHPKFGVSGH